ncbi:glutathione peroxidase [Streptomyces sp. URMC 129]|uniref:glutathione peroxidase n=1 Tax=Streptomyces sp. URMC 129 TaxID=3423407 RepID=UPI003F1A7334
MNLLDTPIARLDGTPATLGDLTGGKVALVVNVASRCGLTPQYAGLEALQKELGDGGFTVVGVPCNQFGGQEPGTAGEIQEFCSTTYGVTFPLTEKIEVNGAGRHPLYRELTAVPDAAGQVGDIQWNFEKFLLAKDGSVTARFRPAVEPADPALRAAIQSALA